MSFEIINRVMYDPVHAGRIKSMQPTLPTDIDMTTFTRLYRRPKLSQQGFVAFSKFQGVACTRCEHSVPPRICEPSVSNLRCTECNDNNSCTLYTIFQKETLCERFNLSSERYDEKVEEMTAGQSTRAGDVDHDQADDNDTTTQALVDEYLQQVNVLEQENLQLRRAMSQLQKEKDELQGISVCQHSLATSAHQTIATGPEGVPVPVLATFLVAEMGHWVSMELQIGSARASGPGNVTLPSSIAENARQQCLERIRFLRMWMSNLLPSISPEIDAIMQTKDVSDDLERALRLEEAISNEMNALKDRLKQEQLEAEEKENERQKAEAELTAILARDAETQQLMAHLAAKRLELMSVIQLEDETS
ncbi:hypothetical protein BDN71DRAFT_1509025 [Pleurotus eryngii]|uniref:Uncharacterized protein n=1 Tax=Pleurotus eryngii TaxID=5323 RepID=A0A9P5ZSW4_PLEER|nr:hypothetical protein BDN71DRAFT_1509025 [Pleurotus eryngii]